jgi:hypothetical protein
VAAGIQAGIGNVAAGSAFAVAQSIAMGGAVPALVPIVGAGVGAAGVGAAAAVAGAGGGGGGGPGGGGVGASAAGADAGPGTAGADSGAATDDAAFATGGRLVDAGVVRTGPDRCRMCKRRSRQICRHPHHDPSSRPNPGL